MSKPSIDFNVKSIERIKHTGKNEVIRFDGNLYLRVRASSKTWVFRSSNNGKQKFITIGTFPDISPTEAKREALELARQSNAITANVKTLIEAYYTGMVEKKHKHPQQAKHYLDLIVAQFGNSTIRSVKRLELTTWLRTYSKDRPRAGDMMRSHLKKLFAYAVECGYIDNSPAEGITNAYTPHDLRRTFATRLNDAGVEPFVVEKCTNHTMEGVMAVYNCAEYEAQRIEAAHKMQAIIMQIINKIETK